MKISPAQRKALDRLAQASAERLIRFPGGFWSYPGCATFQKNFSQTGRQAVPDWWVGINTVRALEKIGVLVRASRFPEEWRDDRLIRWRAIQIEK